MRSTEVTSFDQFKAEIPSAAVIDKMVTFYNDPDDVDLFVKGILESEVGTGALGSTFGCLLSQFKRLRICRWFWYENQSEVLRLDLTKINSKTSGRSQWHVCSVITVMI